jgi:hypothetical protein
MSAIVLDLGKKFELNLTKAGFDKIPLMRTRTAIDKSGSMDDLYRNGFVEKTIELFMGAAAKFDDNGELEYTFFNTSADDMKSIDINSYKNIRIPSADYGTRYVPALKELADVSGKKSGGIFGSIFGGKNADKEEPPVYIGFITDGDANDQDEAEKFMKDLEGTRNFVQFIVLGNQVTLRNIEKLANHSNAAYSVIKNPSKLSVDELYDIIANQKLLNWYTTLTKTV